MPRLKNGKYELFAQKVAAGMKKYEAYLEAYPDKKDMTSVQLSKRANRLLQGNPEIRKRVEEIADEIEKSRMEANVERVRQLAISRDEVIARYVEMADMAREHTISVTVNRNGDEIEIYDSKAANVEAKALENLSKILGYDAPVEMKQDIVISFATSEDDELSM